MFEFGALLEVKLLPLSMPGNGIPHVWAEMLGNRCRENTRGLTTRLGASWFKREVNSAAGAIFI